MLKGNYSGVEAVVAWLLPLALLVNMWISPGSLVLWEKQTAVLRRELKGGILRRLYRDISFTSAS
jgi:hypothetical protein